MLKRILGAAFIAVLAGLCPAFGQGGPPAGFFVVTTCGTLPNVYVASQVMTPTIDVNGNVCMGSSAGSGGVFILPSSATAAGITPVVSASAEATHVLKNAAGNLYSVYAVNQTATPGYLAVINATSIAAPPQAITPLDCVPLPANGSAQINYASGPAAIYSTGITAIVSAASCFSYTAGVTAFFSGRVK